MLFLLILLTGLTIGVLPGLLGLDRKFSAANIAVALLGATAGAFLGFGDAPFLENYPVLNETTLMIGVASVFVLVKVSVARIRSAR